MVQKNKILIVNSEDSLKTDWTLTESGKLGKYSSLEKKCMGYLHGSYVSPLWQLRTLGTLRRRLVRHVQDTTDNLNVLHNQLSLEAIQAQAQATPKHLSRWRIQPSSLTRLSSKTRTPSRADPPWPLMPTKTTSATWTSTSTPRGTRMATRPPRTTSSWLAYPLTSGLLGTRLTTTPQSRSEGSAPGASRTRRAHPRCVSHPPSHAYARWPLTSVSWPPS